MDGVLGGVLRHGATTRRFDEYYRCYPVAMLPGPERENVNHGGKVIMPPSALDKLTRLHITYPMLFELHNGAKERMTHAGVLEFIAEEGKIYLPFWVRQTISSLDISGQPSLTFLVSA
jgi:ubiquitin fusion degradation protein 1